MTTLQDTGIIDHEKILLILIRSLAASCTVKTVPDIGTGFEVTDTTLSVTDPYTEERDVEPEDRVEVFFSPDIKLKDYYRAPCL